MYALLLFDFLNLLFREMLRCSLVMLKDDLKVESYVHACIRGDEAYYECVKYKFENNSHDVHMPRVGGVHASLGLHR